ncbi:monooxygenase [Variovorax boronicumulans]|uniref:monooxygenase n=1 Tax=Variovorax boronicumulans TaxID=436515 RepID=UPI001C58BAAE
MSHAPPTTLLQFDFPFAGPWGAELGSAMNDLALDIAGEDGLLWKIWTENQAAGRAGGIYLFADAASAERYRTKHAARLQAFGVEGVVAHSFAVNAALTHITRGPLS